MNFVIFLAITALSFHIPAVSAGEKKNTAKPLQPKSWTTHWAATRFPLSRSAAEEGVDSEKDRVLRKLTKDMEMTRNAATKSRLELHPKLLRTIKD